MFARTGSIIESNNPFVIEQMKKSDAYKEVVEEKKEAVKPVKRKAKKTNE
jgi:hypothetical protein